MCRIGVEDLIVIPDLVNARAKCFSTLSLALKSVRGGCEEGGGRTGKSGKGREGTASVHKHLVHLEEDDAGGNDANPFFVSPRVVVWGPGR